MELCPNCGGEGVVDGLIVGDTTTTEPCRRCHGSGTIDEVAA